MASKEQKLAIKIAGEIEKSLYESTKLTKKELEDIAKTAAGSTGKVRRSFEEAGQSVDKLGGIADKAFSLVATAAKTAATAAAGLITASIAVGSSFEEQMSTVKAISGAAGDDFDALSEKAKYMGATTKFTATEAGKALEYMGMAGWKTKEMLSGIEGVMYLAAASGEDLGTVSDIVTDAMTALKMSADGFTEVMDKNGSMKQVENATHFADILAAAATNSNTNVGMMGESFKYAAPLAGALKFSAEDLAIALGLAANSGIKASMAGTTLRSAFTNMVNPSQKMAQMMDSLGISVTKSDGSMKSLKEIMDMLREKMKSLTAEEQEANIALLTGKEASELAQDAMKGLTAEEVYFQTATQLGTEAVKDYTEAQLNNALKTELSKKEISNLTEEEKRKRVALMLGTTALSGMTEAEQAQAAATIFGKQALSGMLAIINASEEDYDKLTEAIYNCDGAAKEMSDIRIDNLNGDIEILKSGLEGLGIQVYEGMSGNLRGAVQIATDYVSEISVKMKDKLPTVMRQIREFTGTFLEFADPVISLGKWLINNPNVIISTMAGIGATLATFKVAQGIKNVAGAFSTLGAMLTNPFIASLMAVAAAIGIGVGIATAIKQADKAAKEQNLAKHFGTISLSMDELKKAAESILDTGVLKEVNQALEEIARTKESFDKLGSTTDDLNRLNWKISMGFEISETERNAYQEAIQSYINGSKDMLIQDQYSVNLVMDMFLDDSPSGNNIKDKMNGFYSDLILEAEGYAEKIAEHSANVFNEKGVIDFDEAEEVAKYIQKMENVTKMIADAEQAANFQVLSMKYGGGNLTPESFMNLMEEIQKQTEESRQKEEEAARYAFTKYNAAYQNGDLTKKEYDTAIEDTTRTYLNNTAQTDLQGINFALETIMSQYGDELERAMPGYMEKARSSVDEAMSEIEGGNMSGFGKTATIFMELHEALLNTDGLEGSTKDAIGDLFQYMQPLLDALADTKGKLEDAGAEVDEAIINGISSASAVGALSGDEGSVWRVIGETLDNEEYQEILKKAKKNGGGIPEEIAESMNSEESEKVMSEASMKLYKYMNQRLIEDFEKAFDVKAKVNVTTIPSGGPFQYTEKVEAKADGGIVTSPILTTFAEEGPEAAIPLDGSQNAIDLWKRAGEILGTYNNIQSKNPYLNGEIKAYAKGGIVTSPVLTTFAEEGPEAAIPLDGSQNAIDLWQRAGEILGVYNKDVFQETKQVESTYEKLTDVVPISADPYQNAETHSKTNIFQNITNLWQRAGEILSGYNKDVYGEEEMRYEDPQSTYERLKDNSDSHETLMSEFINNTVSSDMNVGGIELNQTYNFYGGAPSKKDIVAAGKETKEELEEMIERQFEKYKRKLERVRFADG